MLFHKGKAFSGRLISLSSPPSTKKSRCGSLFRSHVVTLETIDQDSGKEGAHHQFHQAVTTMDINWLWLAVGLVPYSIKRHTTKDAQLLTVKTLFWRLTIRWKQGQRSWDVYIPFIEHLRQ